jgi:hypothetical protein
MIDPVFAAPISGRDVGISLFAAIHPVIDTLLRNRAA